MRLGLQGFHKFRKQICFQQKRYYYMPFEKSVYEAKLLVIKHKTTFKSLLTVSHFVWLKS